MALEDGVEEGSWLIPGLRCPQRMLVKASSLSKEKV